jgi:hypothetical protein
MVNYPYYQAKDIIDSGQPYSLETVATAWRNFAEALRNASAHTMGTTEKVTAQYGTPYQSFGDRAAPIANWMNGVSSNADTVASGLSTASTTGSSAQITAWQEDYSYSQDVDRIIGPQDAMSLGRMNAIQRREAQAAAVLNGEIAKWSSAYSAFQPGTIGAAPTTTSSSGGSGGTGGTGGGALPAPGPGTSGGSRPPAGGGGKTGTDFPQSSVIGPGGGDFAGWVRDPRTGFLIDPATGQEFDPTTGRWIDPVTGKPFGDVVRYASRLEGLSGGVSTTSGLLGGTGAGPGAGMDGMFGGVLPPSLAASNPAANQLRQSAADSMAAKAYAAQQLALKEASQGGRPYLPPTQAGLAGSAWGNRAGNRTRLVTEPEGTWTGRGGRGTTGGRRGGPAGEEEPLLSAGGATRGRGAGRNGPRARTAGGMAEPFEEEAGAAGARGSRGAGTNGNRSSYLPAMQGGQSGQKNDRKRGRPDWLVEDDVWSANQAAGPAVLGED